MNRYRAVVFALACMVLMIIAFPVSAYWAQNGVSLCAAFGSRQDPQMAPDGAGGAIVAWCDERNGNEDIYAQRVNAAGVPLWGDGGIAVCTDWSYQRNPVVVSDGAGGAIIAWQDDRAGNNDIYAQRVNASGTALWMADGQAICSATGNQMFPEIASDGTGGAIIAWIDSRSISDYDIYAQRVSAYGTIMWMWDGAPVCTAGNFQMDHTLVSDGTGGAIIAWNDLRSGSSYDVYAQRMSDSGIAQWTADGVALCLRPQDQIFPAIASDGAGGAVVAWMDARSGYYDIYSQRVNASGAAQWAANGVALCAASYDQIYPALVPDGSGGAIAAWMDARSGTNYDVYAQRTNASGAAQWTANGVAVCTVSSDENEVRIASDGAGGVFLAWSDLRSGRFDIYSQRLSAAGVAQWTGNGIPVCAAFGDQYQPRIAADGAGGFIAAWHDRRAGYDIYGQLVDSQGRTGYLAPDIYAARDVPGDQGGSVYLSWYAARADRFKTGDASYYSIWRAISPGAALLALDEGASFLRTLADLDPSRDGPVVRVQRVGSLEYFWELVDSQGASYKTAYGKPVATLFDSTGVCHEYHYFQVVAHSSDPFVFWESGVDSGRSVDNLAPAPLVGLAGEQTFEPAGLELSWRPNREGDLGGYAIYRGTSPDFVPGPENLIASTADTLFLDGDWSWSGGWYYKVAAVDVHGNEGGCALLGPDGVTGGDPPRAPAAGYLAQNVPNPFNPATRISFGLEAAAFVRLRVYDAAGRLVRALVEEARPAGHFTETWDGRDTRGAEVSSGVYFYRLEAGPFAETRKMVLLR
ncbi:MAG: hypothetical protein C4574_05945 [Candidatus Latescibacterota bacterium]|nr:MAG: hypothetical protein C4574_05945 [Candidatus Latescibacterota bacterium]